MSEERSRDKTDDRLQSLSQAAADVQRLCLNIALARRIGADWKLDLIRKGEYIKDLASRLGMD